MALGGGVFVSQNKKLPGAYINFVSAASASATLSDRGIAAFPVPMEWGEEGKVITLNSDDFLYRSQKLLGYGYGHEKVDGLREAFKHATKVLLYRVNTNSAKATCEFCDAKYGGKRGNDLSIVITENVDEPSKFDVKILLDLSEVDVQKAASNTNDLAENDFVTWKKGVTLKKTAKTPLSGGTSGTVDIAGFQKAFEAFESETFNCIGIPTGSSPELKKLAITWTKRMRDEVGVKFQTVVFQSEDVIDDKGIINVVSSLKGTDGKDPRMIYWVTGAQAGCKVNASCTNMTYDGEFDVDVSKTQSELEACIDKGEFVFHKVGDEVRVLTDINSKVTTSAEEGEDFKSNQVIRVLDQIANDIAVLFNTKYLGKIPNNDAGRISLWNDIVKHHQELQTMGAIENFDPENVTVMRGDSKKSVVVDDRVTPVCAMEQLYMSVLVS